MKKNKLYLIAVLGITSATAFAGVVEHDNYICGLTRNGNQVGMSLDESAYSYRVTKGQPFHGFINVLTNTQPDSSCIVVFSGNKNSTDVVDWVKGKMKADKISWEKENMAMNRSHMDQMPNELNFAVKGNLTLAFMSQLTNTIKTYYCPNIILAQGITYKSSFGFLIPHPVTNLWLMSNLQNDKYRENKTIFNCYDSSDNSLQKMMMFRNTANRYDITDPELVIELFGVNHPGSDTPDSNLDGTVVND